jgi:PPOX class probable F420-dependent enzyme
MLVAMTDEYPPGSGPPPRIFTEAEGLAAIGANQRGILATVRPDGSPQLSNMLYVWDAATTTMRMSTRAARAKVRYLRANPKATLHVPGADFFSYVVGEGTAELSGVSTTPGDAAGQELFSIYAAMQDRYGADLDDSTREAFFKQMVVEERLVIRLKVTKVHGMIIDVG